MTTRACVTNNNSTLRGSARQKKTVEIHSPRRRTYERLKDLTRSRCIELRDGRTQKQKDALIGAYARQSSNESLEDGIDTDDADGA